MVCFCLGSIVVHGFCLVVQIFNQEIGAKMGHIDILASAVEFEVEGVGGYDCWCFCM